MSNDGLWRDDLRCGCQKGKGHVCRPIWMTEAEWAGADTAHFPDERPQKPDRM